MPARRARATLPTATFRALVGSRDVIHARWDQPLPVADLAREAGLSPHHFIRAFERAFGATPHRYQVGLRLARAKDLLRRGASATEACFETGFSSLGSWSTLFAREVGRSPGAFRREMARLVQVPAPFPRVPAPLCFLRHFAGAGAVAAISEKRAATRL
jgi:AraC-like DNA-binding protein